MMQDAADGQVLASRSTESSSRALDMAREVALYDARGHLQSHSVYVPLYLPAMLLTWCTRHRWRSERRKKPSTAWINPGAPLRSTPRNRSSPGV